MLDLKQMKVALEQLETEKRIPKARITDAIEQSLAAAYKKDYGEKGQIVRCKLDFDTGVMEFEQVKVVVDETTVRMPKFDENGDEIREEILFDAEDKAVDNAFAFLSYGHSKNNQDQFHQLPQGLHVMLRL